MSLKLLVNSRDYWEPLLEEIDKRIKEYKDNLATTPSWDSARFIQGEIQSLVKLKQLRDKLNPIKDEGYS